jgi:nitrite reductase (cytochrome c-552)
MPCHREGEDKLRGIVNQKLTRKNFLMQLTMDNLAKAHLETAKAVEIGATAEELKQVREHIRHGQWRWDYSIASHGSFFHAPEETLRLLGSANDEAQKARILLVRVLAKHGLPDFQAPDFSNKENAQSLAGVPLKKLIEAKMKFKATLEKEWMAEAAKKGKLNMSSQEGIDQESSYFDNRKKK